MVLAFTAVVSAAAFSASPARAQTLLSPTGAIYESSQNTTRTATNLFTAAPVFGVAQSNSTTADFFAGRAGSGGDARPIVAFDLGSTAAASGLGYSQNVLGNQAGADKVASIDVYSLTSAQYGAFILTLQAAPAANGGATSGSQVPLAAPTAGNFTGMQTITVTDTSGDGVFTRYNFPAALNGEYFVVQFTGVAAPATGSGGFPGGQELRLFSVPEPSAWLMMLLGGAAVLGMTMRARRSC